MLWDKRLGLIDIVCLRCMLLLALAGLVPGCAGGGNAGLLSDSSATTVDAVQRQLAALPCPPGVSESLWDKLTGELRDQLSRRTSAEVLAGPPIDELSRVTDLLAQQQSEGSVHLRWSYKNTGDYDQNSESNVSDLTPIGRNFHKTVSGAEWKQARVADGDVNGEVNISDITPIGRCFLQTVSEYQVEYKPKVGTYLVFSKVAEIKFAEADQIEDEWLKFELSLPARTGYYRVVPYYLDQRGIEGEPVFFKVTNDGPTAILNADQQIGTEPLDVVFDASESSDPDGNPLTFAWDWEGDGVIDYSSGALPVVDHTYTDLGDYAPIVTVTDSLGARDTDQLMVYCHEWEQHVVCEGIGMGSSNVSSVRGKPAFTFSAIDTQNERPFARAIYFAQAAVEVPSSSADWQTTLVLPPEFWIREDG